MVTPLPALGRRPSAALVVAGLVLCLAAVATAAGPAKETAEPFPRPLESYTGEEGLPLAKLLFRRAVAEPANAAAAGIFLLAILHTFMAPRFLALSHRLKHEHGKEQHRLREEALDRGEPEPPETVSFRAEVLHFLGEVEAVFGFWVVPLFAAVALLKSWPTAISYLGDRVNYTEAAFVVVVMTIASTRPVLELAERGMAAAASLGGGTPMAWAFVTLALGPLLGSFITEPAAMTICAILLGKRLFALGPHDRLRYATLGLLFVNVSIGGTLTHFAAPPVLMVAGPWGWGTGFMLSHFGWKAAIAVVVSTAGYVLVFRKEFARLAGRAAEAAAREAAEAPARAAGRAIPVPVTAVHLFFLAWTVVSAHHVALFVGGFLFFLAFTEATLQHQSEVRLRSPLLVGFFLAGLVTHGTLQQWWIAPVLSRLGELPLYFGALVLTAFNDNAAITYLASLVPGFTAELKYAVVAGAVAGGGLTVIANAPNPAGQSILAKHFPDGVSPLRLFLGAAVPTAVATLAFLLL